MNGHQPLLEMRRSGIKPACVWVLDDDSDLSKEYAANWQNSPNEIVQKLYAHVRIDERDLPEAIDFRFLVGMTVHLESSRGEARSMRLFESIKKFQPSILACCHGDDVWYYAKESNG